MFRETIVDKWDIVTIHSRLLYTIPHMMNTRYRFYQTSRDPKQHHQLSCTVECERLLGLPPFWKILYCNVLVTDLSNKFVDWKCFGNGWCLMDAFRLNNFIRSRQVHSNNIWHNFHGSIGKFFGCMDHNLAWLYFSENDVCDSSAYLIHWDFAIMSLIVEAAQWLIQEHCSG